MSTDTSVQREMPRYFGPDQEKIWALKIKKVVWEQGGVAILFPEEEGYAPIRVGLEFLCKHFIISDGYYLVHEDGTPSWMTVEDFEAKYTPEAVVATDVHCWNIHSPPSKAAPAEKPEKDLPAVAGPNTLTPEELEHRAQVLLAESEDNLASPMLVGFLCDVVRFARAHQKEGQVQPPGDDGSDMSGHSIGRACPRTCILVSASGMKP